MENANLLNIPSRAEYIVCTKALNSNKSNAVLGFSLFMSPSGLILLLGSGQLVTLNLIGDPELLREFRSIAKDKSTTSIQKTKPQSQSFELHIKNILATDVSNPILKLDKSVEPSPKETLELLTHATQVLREQYFQKHDKAKQEIEKRVKVLQLLKEQQQKEIKQLLADKEVIRRNAERLAERYDDICDKQQLLFKRAQEVIRLATIQNPPSNMGEMEFQQQIEKINAITKVLANNVELARRKIKYQDNQINQYNVTTTKKTVELQPKAESAIKEILSDM